MLYEVITDGHYALTRMSLEWGDKACFTLSPAAGDASLLPDSRAIRVLFRGVEATTDVQVRVDGQPLACQPEYDAATQTLT